jgi:hypothetical protein
LAIAMPTANSIREILLLIVFILPILMALFKLFQLREQVYDALQKLEYQETLLGNRLENLEDKLLLGFNGTKELIEHKASRLGNTQDRQGDRLDDVEQFLVKTTDFVRRSSR